MKKTVSMLVAAGFTVFALACGSDSVLTASKGLSVTAGSSTDTTATSTGPVASLTVSPRLLRMARGYATIVSAVARDAAGAYVPSAHASWQTSNSTIATVSDEGRVTAVANGTAWIFATVAAAKDSAQVIVSDTPQDTAVVTTQPAGVATYDLIVKVVGAVGADTTQTQPVSGVALTVTRTSDAQGHAITPVVAGTATTDATGSASLLGVAGGNFTVAAVPPAASAYRSATVITGAPLASQATVRVLLLRNP
jgi:Bacterial Ig-like domain (group 2)